jgi:hypothetical protein
MEAREDFHDLVRKEMFDEPEMVDAIERLRGKVRGKKVPMNPCGGAGIVFSVEFKRLGRDVESGDPVAMAEVGIHLTASASGVQKF